MFRRWISTRNILKRLNAQIDASGAIVPKLANPTKKQLIKMLDRRWSAYIRNHGRCENCGTTNELTESHIIGRTYIKTRFDVRNNQCLCASCHGKFESQPISFARWIETTSCGKYVDTMIIQANNATIKPDYQLWLTLYDMTIKHKIELEELRQKLDQQILWSINDLLLVN